MNPPQFSAAIRAAGAGLAAIPGVRSVILFGSAARARATEESDIDLFVVCDRALEDRVSTVLNDLADRHRVAFSAIFYREEERKQFDKQFLESILRYGRPLIGELPQLTPGDLDLQPLRLVSYRTEGLAPAEKAKLLREIDGYRTRKRVGRKRYVASRSGFLKSVGGWRVGRGAVVIPEEAVEDLDAILRRHGATRTMVPIWSQRP